MEPEYDPENPSKLDLMLENINKLSPAFPVCNGTVYEVHQREIDYNGRSWERTTAGPFKTEAEAINKAHEINYIHFGIGDTET
jgi:hypothetical protein